MAKKRNRTNTITKVYCAVPVEKRGQPFHKDIVISDELGISYSTPEEVVENYDYEDGFNTDETVEIAELTIKRTGVFKRVGSRIKIEKVK